MYAWQSGGNKNRQVRVVLGVGAVADVLDALWLDAHFEHVTNIDGVQRYAALGAMPRTSSITLTGVLFHRSLGGSVPVNANNNVNNAINDGHNNNDVNNTIDDGNNSNTIIDSNNDNCSNESKIYTLRVNFYGITLGSESESKWMVSCIPHDLKDIAYDAFKFEWKRTWGHDGFLTISIPCIIFGPRYDASKIEALAPLREPAAREYVVDDDNDGNAESDETASAATAVVSPNESNLLAVDVAKVQI